MRAGKLTSLFLRICITTCLASSSCGKGSTTDNDAAAPGSGGTQAGGAGGGAATDDGEAGEATGGGGEGGSADTGPNAGGDASGDRVAAVPYDGPYLHTLIPNPLVSRSKPVFPPAAAGINDGRYKTGGPSWNAGRPTAAAPAFAAIQVGAGYRRLLLSWTASGNYNYTDVQFGAPSDYRLETSNDSTNGSDGTWNMVGVAITGNTVRTRAHSFDFQDQSWVRMVVTGSVANVSIDEIDVHDISNGSEDTWVFLGDSITAFAYDRDTPQDQPSFAENVHARHPAYFPAMINAGIGSELTGNGLARVDNALLLNPDFHFFAIGYGTNDEWGNHTDTSVFTANLQSMIDKIVAAGRVPVIAHVPASPDGNHNTLDLYNTAIDQLATRNKLPFGPDLYGWFLVHADQLQPDRVHPLPTGRVAMNQLWAGAMDAFYPSP
jgi:lysophospholipase L1-like esterase